MYASTVEVFMTNQDSTFTHGIIRDPSGHQPLYSCSKYQFTNGLLGEPI